MKRIYIQIVDKVTENYNFLSVKDSVIEGKEVANALGYLGIRYGEIQWEIQNENFKCGNVAGTTKLVVVTII